MVRQNVKSAIKSAFPQSVWISQRVRKVLLGTPSLDQIFSNIYRNNLWADPESVSGRGSTLARTAVIRNALPAMLKDVGAKSLLDAACGDFNWMQHVDLGEIRYLGVDVVAELIANNQRTYGNTHRSFVVMDLTKGDVPKTDVILCRDCFIHLSFNHARAVLANLKRSGSEYLIATTHMHVSSNTDIDSGGWHSVNLQLTPYNFPSPLQLVMESGELGKGLGMWRLQELPTK
jgi:hypothetical protein